MKIVTWKGIRRFINRSGIGYFAPLVAAVRLIRKRRWNYVHQLRVAYRYSFPKHKT